MQNNEKSIIITGADGALGNVVTATLLAQGWKIYACVYNEKSKINLEANYPNAMNNKLFISICDVSKAIEVKKLISSTQNIFGLVHLAGGFKPGVSLANYSEADYDFLFNLNTKSTFLLLNEIMPILKECNEGSIITIGAKPVLHPTNENAVYTASKAALVALTLAAAEEGRPYQIRTNCIIPATLQTPANLTWASEEMYQTFTPLQDIADTIAMLLSDVGRGITGNLIPMYHKIGN